MINAKICVRFLRPVRVIRFLSADTIEEGIYAIAQDKLQLEKDLSADDNEKKVSGQTHKPDMKFVSRCRYQRGVPRTTYSIYFCRLMIDISAIMNDF